MKLEDMSVKMLPVHRARVCGMAIVSWECVCEGVWWGLYFIFVCWRIYLDPIIEYAMT